MAKGNRELFCGYDLELADWRDAGQCRCRLEDYFEELVLVLVVRIRPSCANRMRLDDHVDQGVLGWNGIEFERNSPVIPNDFDPIVTDFLLLEETVVNVGHDGGDVIDDLTHIVPPRIRVISVGFRPQSASVDFELIAGLDDTTKLRQKTSICGRAMFIVEDFGFFGLIRGDIQDADFMSVDDWSKVDDAQGFF